MKSLEELRQQAEEGWIKCEGLYADEIEFLSLRSSFRIGWDAAVKELARWRNPAEELPSDSMRVLVHVQLPNRASLVTEGWYGTHPSEQGWHIDISWEGLHVVGWRPLLDVSDL